MRIKTIAGPPHRIHSVINIFTKAFLENSGFSALVQHHLRLDPGVIIVFQYDIGERTICKKHFLHFLDVILDFFLPKASRKPTSSSDTTVGLLVPEGYGQEDACTDAHTLPG